MVYGYVRVSTGRQADEGESLQAQEQQIKGYAMMTGLRLDKTFIEKGVSGAMPFGERQQGAHLLAAIQPGDVVITPKLDRMFRSALDALNVLQRLKDEGVALHMIDLGGDVTGNGIAKLVFTILSAVAEAERDRIRERIQDVKTHQKRQNRYLGGTVPFGWSVGDDGALVKDESQQGAIRTMRRMRSRGKSLRDIAEAMQAKGFTVSHAGVKNITSRAGAIA
jgi:putative DNA-invertase from lambdoid prophage Rac